MSVEEEDKLLLRNSFAHINHINQDNYTGMYSPLQFFCVVFLPSLCLKKWQLYLFTIGMALGSVGICLCVCECRCKCVFYTIFHNPDDITWELRIFIMKWKKLKHKEDKLFLPGPKTSRLWSWHSYSNWDEVKGSPPHQIKKAEQETSSRASYRIPNRHSWLCSI